jgi:alpha-mannosidase
MALTKEWKNRINLWIDELQNHFYRELGEVEFQGFVTKEQLSQVEAVGGDCFEPMPPGTAWGAKWEYGWFQGRIILPKAAAGKRICLRLDVGGESAIYLNGVNAGAKDLQHHEITICRKGVPGQVYEIVAESYAGHGPRLERIGPTPPERVAIPEPGPTQAIVGRSSFGIWEEAAYQLWLDVDTLYKVRENINQNSLRCQEIDQGLQDFTLIVDFELDYAGRAAGFTAARGRLARLLRCVNGSTAPVMYLFGQSHLDLAWLWPWAETVRKCARTLATQLGLMDEYPEYRYLLTQPPLFQTLQKRYPGLYQRVKAKVASGQLLPEGGMWVESDTNLPGGESLIRQFIYGKAFFKEELGVDSELLWLPDVFGFSAALPQIILGCGVKYFCTKKIFDNYNGGEPFPYNLFMWEGIDGSRVLTHIIRKSNSPLHPEILIRRWEADRIQKDGISTFIFSFGFGDGGGGPVRDHLEYAGRMKDLEGVPRTKMCSPNDFFHDIEAEGLPKNRYVGELYFQAHRGTYTTQAKLKQGNRRAEFALREAELWAAAATWLQGWPYPAAVLETDWKKVLFNQFHDILPGSSIQRVNQEAAADYREVLANAARIKNDALANWVGPDDAAIAIFNSLSWERSELIPLPAGFEAVSDPEGKILPAQEMSGQFFAEVALPACGWTTLRRSDGRAANQNLLRVSLGLLENEFLRLKLNENGEITSLYDKESRRELAAGPCNCLKLYKDVTTCYDAWDIDSMYEKLPVALEGEGKAAVSLINAGPLAATLQIRRRLHNSAITQEISLRRGSRRVEFKTAVEWREDHKLLKVAFPLQIHTEEAVSEIQFGFVSRPNHKSRPYDADRYEVCNQKWTAIMEANRGCALLNDCKYGISVTEGTMSLTLLKAPLVPDMDADRGLHEFTYAFYAWNGPFFASGVTREAYELNCPVTVVPGLAGARSLFRVDRPEIIIDTVKLAEDGSKDLIVRLYEAMNTTTRTCLTTTLPVAGAAQTNMLEEFQQELPLRDGQIELNFRPFEIKTLRLKAGVK